MNKQKKYKNPKINIAVKELNEYRTRQREIDMLKSKQAEYQERFCEIKTLHYDQVRVQGGEYKNKIEQVALEWADLDVEIQTKQQENERLLWFVKGKLDSLDYTKSRCLELYYIKVYSLDKVAEIMCYSFEGIKKVKNRALLEYAEL